MLVARLWQGVTYISYDEYMDEQDRLNALDDREYKIESARYDRKMKQLRQSLIFAETWRVPVIALIWVGLEYLRELAGFSWNTLAISQYKSYTVAQLSAIGGTAAISFVIVAVNAGIAGTAIRLWRTLYLQDYPRIKRHFDLWVALIIALCAMIYGVREYKAIEKTIGQLDSPDELMLVGAINNCQFASNGGNCFTCANPFSFSVGLSICNVLHFNDMRKRCSIQSAHSHRFCVHL